MLNTRAHAVGLRLSSYQVYSNPLKLKVTQIPYGEMSREPAVHDSEI